MKKTKYSVLLPTLAIAAMFMTACDSEQQKALNVKWEATASQNAKAYIKQKYGFNAKVIEAKVDRNPGLYDNSPTSNVFVEMQYNNRDFTVYITGEKERTDGIDSYQAPEVHKALFDKINSEKDGLKVLDIYPHYNMKDTPDEPFYSTYFDGSNLDELLKDGHISFDAFYVQTDLSDPDDFSWFNSMNMDAKFVSCRDKKILKANRYTRKTVAPQPVYCNNSRILIRQPGETESKTTFQTYDIYQYGDFYYYVNSSKNCYEGEPSGAMPYIEEIDPMDVNVFLDRGASPGSDVISKTYSISSYSPMYVHVYYPHNKIHAPKNLKDYSLFFDCAKIINDDHGSTRLAVDDLINAGDYAYECFKVEPDIPVRFMYISCYDE